MIVMSYFVKWPKSRYLLTLAWIGKDEPAGMKSHGLMGLYPKCTTISSYHEIMAQCSEIILSQNYRVISGTTND